MQTNIKATDNKAFNDYSELVETANGDYMMYRQVIGDDMAAMFITDGDTIAISTNREPRPHDLCIGSFMNLAEIGDDATKCPKFYNMTVEYLGTNRAGMHKVRMSDGQTALFRIIRGVVIACVSADGRLKWTADLPLKETA